MSEIKVGLSDNGSWVEVRFPYSVEDVLKIKRIPIDSRKFVGKEKPGGPYWKLRKDLIIMKRLREQFGDRLVLGQRVKNWGHEQVAAERNLQDLSMADDAELERVPKKVASGKRWLKFRNGQKFKLRPYQRADIKFMAEGRSINANQPGSGKTSEYVLAVIEAELEWGFNLVSAPLSALEDPWMEEIKELYWLCGLDEPTILTGDSPAQRKRAVATAKQMSDEGLAFWLILNPYMFRRKKELTKLGKEKVAKNLDVDKDDYHNVFICPELAEIPWNSICDDEFHLNGFTNPETQFNDGLNALIDISQPEMLSHMSGTPMGGKPIKLHAPLKSCGGPKIPPRWPWARQWLVVNREVVNKEGKEASTIEGIQEGREQEFYEHCKPYLIRRTKPEVLPGLPPKNRIDVWCKMSPKQKEQYETFERDAELRIDIAEGEGRLSASNVLAEWLRLKQFAAAYCDVEMSSILDANDMPKITVKQTTDSGKFEQLLEKLGEENVLARGKDDDKAKCALIFSQFTGVINAAGLLMDKEKVPWLRITGEVKTASLRKAIKQSFQKQSLKPIEDWIEKNPRKKVPEQFLKLLKTGEPPRVLIINTKAGGTALTLSRADSVHILDETWDPDDQEQDEDRAHRGDELTEAKSILNIYFYRTKESIEEYIQKLTIGKEFNNETVLELRRYMESRRAAVAA